MQFCKGVKIWNFSSEITFGQVLWTFGDFYWSHCLQFAIVKFYFEKTRMIEKDDNVENENLYNVCPNI